MRHDPQPCCVAVASLETLGCCRMCFWDLYQTSAPSSQFAGSPEEQL